MFLSLSFRLYFISWQAMVRPATLKEPLLQHLLAWLSGRSRIFCGPRAWIPALYALPFPFQSTAVAVSWKPWRETKTETIFDQMCVLDMFTCSLVFSSGASSAWRGTGKSRICICVETGLQVCDPSLEGWKSLASLLNGITLWTPSNPYPKCT
jgi:hypothetical protein